MLLVPLGQDSLLWSSIQPFQRATSAPLPLIWKHFNTFWAVIICGLPAGLEWKLNIYIPEENPEEKEELLSTAAAVLTDWIWMAAVKHVGDLRALMKGSGPAAQLWLPWFHFSGGFAPRRVPDLSTDSHLSFPQTGHVRFCVGKLLTVHSSSQSSPVCPEFPWKLYRKTRQHTLASVSFTYFHIYFI